MPVPNPLPQRSSTALTAPLDQGLFPPYPQRNGIESQPDEIFRSGQNQIQNPDPSITPDQYQLNSKRLLIGFFDLWVNPLNPRTISQPVEAWELTYVINLTGLYLDRVESFQWELREGLGGMRWILERTFTVRAKLLSRKGVGLDEEVDDRMTRMEKAIENLERRVVGMVGKGNRDDHGRMRMRRLGDRDRGKAWESLFGDISKAITVLDPNKTDHLSQITIFFNSNRTGSSSQHDPSFNSPVGSPPASLDSSSDIFHIPLNTLFQQRALLLALLSFSVSILFHHSIGSPISSIGPEPYYPFVPKFKKTVIRALLHSWPVLSSESRGERSVLEVEYIRLSEILGEVVNPRIWIKIIASLKGRANEACDPTLHEYTDGMEVDEDSDFRQIESRKRGLWRGLDRQLRSALSSTRKIGGLINKEDSAVLIDGMGDISSLVEFIKIWNVYERESDLKEAIVSALSILPCSAPALKPIAYIFASNSSPTNSPIASMRTSLASQPRKRKRDADGRSWTSLTRDLMKTCFGNSLVEEAEQFESQAGFGQETRRRLSVALNKNIKQLKLISSNSEEISAFHKILPSVLYAYAITVQIHPPTFPARPPNSRPALQKFATNLRSIPIAVLSELVRKYDPSMPVKVKMALLDGVSLVLKHVYIASEHAKELKTVEQRMVEMIGVALEDLDRNVRLAASRGLIAIVDFHKDDQALFPAVEPILTRLFSVLGKPAVPAKETALTALGALGKIRSDDVLLAKVASQLAIQLGDVDSWIKSLAHSTILSLAHFHQRTPHKLFYPYFKSISLRLVDSLIIAPSALSDFVNLIDETQENFLETTVAYTVPHVVLQFRKDILYAMGRIMKKEVAEILLDNILEILYHVLMQSAPLTEKGFIFLIGAVGTHAGGEEGGKRDYPVKAGDLLKMAEPVKLLYKLVVDLGDEDISVIRKAEAGLSKAEKKFKELESKSALDLGDFLKPYMLGIISNVNELLQDGQGRKTAQDKIKVIRSLGALMKKIGPTMATFSQQIMVTLQGNLNKPPLRFATLQTWHTFLTVLKFKDIAPHIGPTSAAFVSSWSSFTEEERFLAATIIDYAIVENSEFTDLVLDDVVDLEGIDKLQGASRRLKAARNKWSSTDLLNNLIRRARDENVTISIRALEELKGVLLKKSQFAQLASGDVFDPVVGELVKTLVTSASRDGDHVEDLRDISLDCLGIIGALDPDRFTIRTEETSWQITDNLATLEEAQVFAVHLLVDVLVGAFKATNDTRYQENLAYAIQELSKFCGFTKDLLDKSSSSSSRAPVALRIRDRWKKIPPQKQVTLADMLDTKYVLKLIPEKQFEHPIYTTCPTYREWIQRWTSDLIPKTAAGNARQIFDIFRVVIKSQDVHIARHLLPHIVLNILINGDASARKEISAEIRAVLLDQVDPQGDFPSDRRLLSAQTIFDLMDHISKWLRHQRMDLATRRKEAQKAGTTSQAFELASQQLSGVERVISSIDTQLTAQAALQCKAYARSLLNFEQRILALKKTGVPESTPETQQYYEHLHQIYADLDEPDGMEGVSTKVLSPSLEHQIREHESTGRWTAAQSCWEVQIQESPNELPLHIGLLRCLRNLGHYDTLRTHIEGLTTRRPQWESMLSSFQVEGSWMVGDWGAVENILSKNKETSPELAIARVLVELRSGGASLPTVLRTARLELGRPLTAAGRDSYNRAYDSVIQLHVLHELELIATTTLPQFNHCTGGPNDQALATQRIVTMKSALANRLSRILPSFRAQEPILSMRRTAFDLCATKASEALDSKGEIGKAWLLTSKIARKAGHTQTAYSAVLQARQNDAPYTFVQDAKLLLSSGQALRALQELKHTLDPLIKDVNKAPKDFRLVKAALLNARWYRDADRFEVNDIVAAFKKVIALDAEWEAPYYHLGHFYDKDSSDGEVSMQILQLTVENYARALRFGTKFIYRTMPRMLTIWLDNGAKEHILQLERQKDKSGASDNADLKSLAKMTAIIDKCTSRLPVYQWLTAFPQLVSRIGHPNGSVYRQIYRIIVYVVRTYPLQSIWSMVSVSQSKKEDRVKRCVGIFDKLRAIDEVGNVSNLIDKALLMTKELLKLAKLDVSKSTADVSMDRVARSLKSLAPSPLMIPIQEALTVSLPSEAVSKGKDHNPFPVAPVRFAKFFDNVEVMSSLVRPKKISLVGDDGQTYSFLCKPNDDLRKDARLMDFNAMINKLLKKDSESRRRHLYIRTYAVTPLNDECGLCQWVNHTVPLRNILTQSYTPKGISLFNREVSEIYKKYATQTDAEVAEHFQNTLLPMYSPVFHEWFLKTFPEPSAWLAARLAYGRTYAVMSMVGFVLGLGDRHGENTLYDQNSGDAVHVDLNCLFEKGRTFDVKERVPFRLTHNQVDGFGVTGVEGVYRNACEVTMRILRDNKDSLMSVLETFIHDPLVEWENDKRRMDREKAKSKGSRRSLDNSETSILALAQRSLEPIERKLRGVQAGYVAPNQPAPTKEITVSNQVEALIQEATNPVNLARMYVGWGAYL
ncbi:serine threonine-protein kinase atr [Phaffia rhodozyma]|uniref:non-specific serine/threonine protein kinase n=1 Tax=Phaffia rhodozyma TaxID=264483 RepID=A0A0F7SH85_PHARH|nr:serine threonine-protein kinase atr [Phaffia rhodozyma]